MLIKYILFLYSLINLSFAQTSNIFDKPIIRYVKIGRSGLQISIPNKPGLQFFAFHGAINRFIKPNEYGDFQGIVTKPINEFWTFSNNNIKLEENDVLYYWFHYQINNIKYRSLEQQIFASDIGAPADVSVCIRSDTILDRRLAKCKGELLYQETFENYSSSSWKHEIRIPTEDFAFVSFQDNEDNIFVKDNLLHILPTTPYDDVSIKSVNVPWTLPKCTIEKNEEECERRTSYHTIVPPVVSAKIRSKFSFIYGRVDVRAKLPIGDWIIPQILLEPRDNRYSSGHQDYSSGQMRIAFARGNRDLKQMQNESVILDGRILYGGVIVEPLGIERHFLKHVQKNKHFGEDFHIYSLIWTRDNIQLLVDDEIYGIIKGGFKDDSSLFKISQKTIGGWKSSTNAMAPFDKEFVISFGVSVGGMSDFPDNVLNQGKLLKPWRNGDPKAESLFYKNLNTWKTTWSNELSSLKIDYVKVYAV